MFIDVTISETMEVFYIVVLFTIATFSPIRISAGEQGTVANMKQKMISMILADHKMCKVFNGGEMMNFCFSWKKFPQRLFGYQNMLHNMVSLISAWMIRHRNNFIPVESEVWFPRFSMTMANKKLKRFSLFILSFCMVPFRDLSFFTTSTLAQTFFDHVILQIKRLISRLMRAVAIKPLLPLLSALVFGYKKAASRISFFYTQMCKSCQVKGILFCNSGPTSTWNHSGQWLIR